MKSGLKAVLRTIKNAAFTFGARLFSFVHPDPVWKILSVEGQTSRHEAKHLFAMAKQAGGGCIVEVGSYRGRSTSALALGAKAGNKLPLYAIEPHENFEGVYGGQFGHKDRAAFFRNMLKLNLTDTVRLVNLSSETVTRDWNKPVALLWIDGDHSYEGVKRDVAAWFPHLAPHAPVIFDDATDPAIGPFKVIAELLAEGKWQKAESIGKTVTLRRK